jgi:hypothetical protein
MAPMAYEFTGGLTPEQLAFVERAKARAKLILTLPQFLDGFVPPDYVLDGILLRGFVYCITGMTGGGKTAVALLIAVIASNRKRRDKLGSHNIEPVRVLYIACENATDVRMRMIGMLDKMGLDRDDLDMLVIDRVFDLEENMERIRKEVDAFGGNIGLAFIDTSAAMFMGEDENDNPDMLAYAKLLRELCKLPGLPCVVPLCHPVKHVDNPAQLLPRGGGSFLNEMDGNLTLWAHDERLTTLHWTGKIRGPDFEPIEFRLPTIFSEKLVDSKGRQIPTVMAEAISEAEVAVTERRSEKQENQLLAAMSAKPRGALAEWAADCGWFTRDREPYKSLVVRILDRLVKAKLVTKRGSRFALTKTGKEAAEMAAQMPLTDADGEVPF